MAKYRISVRNVIEVEADNPDEARKTGQKLASILNEHFTVENDDGERSLFESSEPVRTEPRKSGEFKYNFRDVVAQIKSDPDPTLGCLTTVELIGKTDV